MLVRFFLGQEPSAQKKPAELRWPREGAHRLVEPSCRARQGARDAYGRAPYPEGDGREAVPRSSRSEGLDRYCSSVLFWSWLYHNDMSSHYLDPTRQIVAKTMMSRIPTKINSINALVFTENRRNYLITYFKNALLKVEDKICIVQKSGPLRTHRNFPPIKPVRRIFRWFKWRFWRRLVKYINKTTRAWYNYCW